MTPQDFIRKWKPNALSERAAAQEHFLDLCRVFDHPTPSQDDPAGDHFTFEKGAPKTGGGDGFADVWKKGYFAWEYKKKPRNLDDALKQLVTYAAALEKPPLHAVFHNPEELRSKRTRAALTNLYNQRPRWLADAHEALDRSVAAAYGWPEDIAIDDALARLLALSLERAGGDKKVDAKPSPVRERAG